MSGRQPLKGIVYLILSTIFFAAMGACMKVGLERVPLFEAIFVRTAVSSLVLGGMLWKRSLSYVGVNRRMLFYRSAAGFLAMGCGFEALRHIPLADATVLQQTSPLFVAVFAVFWGERVERAQWFYLLVAMIGVVLVLQPEGQFWNGYGLLALAGALFAALAYGFVRQLHQTDHSLVIAFHFASITSLLAIPPALWDFKWPSALDWLALLGAGLFGTGGQIYMTEAYRHDEAARLAPFAYASVAFALLIELIFWNQIPNLYKFLGMVLIVLAGLALARRSLLETN